MGMTRETSPPLHPRGVVVQQIPVFQGMGRHRADPQQMLSGSAPWTRALSRERAINMDNGSEPKIEDESDLTNLGLRGVQLNKGDLDMINRHLRSETHKKDVLQQQGITYEIDVAKSIAEEQRQNSDFMRGSDGRGYWLSRDEKRARFEFFDFGGQLVRWFPGQVPRALEDTPLIKKLYRYFHLTDPVTGR